MYPLVNHMEPKLILPASVFVALVTWSLNEELVQEDRTHPLAPGPIPEYLHGCVTHITPAMGHTTIS